MDPEKYNRSVNLLCPTCGSDQFSHSDDEAQPVTCASCGLQISRADLIQANSENLDEHAKEMAEEIGKDLERHFRDSLTNAFRGSKTIKIM